MATTSINVRVDENLKNCVENILDELGMNMSTAINIYLKKILHENGIPFDMKLMPNAETLMAFAEIEDMKKHPENYKSYASAQEITRDI